MARRRSLSWAAALRDLKDDRMPRHDVREERLRTVAGLRGSPAVALSAWRGRSGRRYVVGVHPATSFDAAEAAEAVVIAVRRDGNGHAELIRATFDHDTPAFWLDSLCRAGATEFHVHRLAGDEAEREAIVGDLMPVMAEAA